MLEATYTWIYGQQQFGKCWCVVRSQPTSGKIFIVKFIRVKYFRMFSVYENIFTVKIKRITDFFFRGNVYDFAVLLSSYKHTIDTYM